jgi:hypothetical protein
MPPFSSHLTKPIREATQMAERVTDDCANKGVRFYTVSPTVVVGHHRKFICSSFQRRRTCVVYRSQQTKILKLARHCAVAGVVLVVGLFAANAVFGPGGPGPNIVKDQPKERVARSAQTLPLEWPRTEQRDQAATVVAMPSVPQSPTVAPAPPVRSAPTPTFTALVGLPTPEEAARATRVAQEKIAAEKAKRRLARERARARAMAAAAAARGFDQQYYGQQTPDYAYAPRQNYGPFGRSQNGWGNGWNGWGSGWNGRSGKW